MLQVDLQAGGVKHKTDYKRSELGRCAQCSGDAKTEFHLRCYIGLVAPLTDGKSDASRQSRPLPAAHCSLLRASCTVLTAQCLLLSCALLGTRISQLTCHID